MKWKNILKDDVRRKKGEEGKSSFVNREGANEEFREAVDDVKRQREKEAEERTGGSRMSPKKLRGMQERYKKRSRKE